MEGLVAGCVDGRVAGRVDGRDIGRVAGRGAGRAAGRALRMERWPIRWASVTHEKVNNITRASNSRNAVGKIIVFIVYVFKINYFLIGIRGMISTLRAPGGGIKSNIDCGKTGLIIQSEKIPAYCGLPGFFL